MVSTVTTSAPGGTTIEMPARVWPGANADDPMPANDASSANGDMDQDTSITLEALSNSGATAAPIDNEGKRGHRFAGGGRRVATITPSFWYPRMNKYRVMAACLTYFGNGVNDSVPGALIPYLESWYHIGYAIVSLIFVTNAAGFILSALCAAAITNRLGRAKALMLSEAAMIAGYVAIACSPPFPVVVAAYLFLGFGNGFNLALNNVFCANLAKSTTIMGVASGLYGVGGILGPVVGTALVSAGIHWARFYIVAVAIRAICLILAGWAYWNYESEDESFSATLAAEGPRSGSSDTPAPGLSSWQTLKRALKGRTTLAGALFIFAYQGAEVSESGWFVSYLIDARGADPTRVGYVTSGFWAGITVGRFTLTHLAPLVGEKRLVFALGVGTIAFQFLAWFLPNTIGNSVAVAFVGLLLGPIYPCAMTIFSRLLPLSLQSSAIGFISSAGSSGGAVVPLLTGLLAQATGTWVLHPVCVGFFVVMLAAWLLLPRLSKRSE